MKTTEVAKKQWCPMARKFHSTGHGLGDGALAASSFNRGDKDGCNCFADKCAAWRWSSDQPRRRVIFHTDQAAEAQPDARPDNVPSNWVFAPFDPSDGDPAAWIEPESDAQARRTGYCGLAGRPQAS